MSHPHTIALEPVDLTRYVRAGDTVMWGQSCAEPTMLTQLLMEQRHAIGTFRCFIGLPSSETCRPEHTDVVSFLSYSGGGPNRALVEAEALDVLPVHYSDLPGLFTTGAVHIDVLMLLVPPPDEDGCYRLGLANEYLSAAIDRARVVIAEVSNHVPRIGGSRLLQPNEVDVVVSTATRPIEVPVRQPSDVDRKIAAHVAGLIPNGATLQVGVGSLPNAILHGLTGHRDLGVHSGLLGDSIADLMELGVINGSHKSLDHGVAVAGVIMGSQRLFDFVDGHPGIHLRETAYTHDIDVLTRQHRFAAINSAFEVDLTGQINAESVQGCYRGALGGAVDFIRGAHRCPGGLPITALPSTAGDRSRIVHSLTGPVSTARSDAGIIISEYGIADLRGLTLTERRQRMLAIAHPEHRSRLAKESAPSRPPTIEGST